MKRRICPVCRRMSFVRIPAGSFMMGSGLGFEDERPVHETTISRAFYLQTTAVTQGQWRAVMGDNPSGFKNGDDYPVERVSWDDAQEFLKRLNQLDPGKNYRLPTEAEWEYACRAGTSDEQYGEMDAISWHLGNSDGQTHPVGKKQPNAWGLYDMLGNVWEWCADWYDENYYESSPATDPLGPSLGQYRVLRGVDCIGISLSIRSARRNRNTPLDSGYNYGFRCAADFGSTQQHLNEQSKLRAAYQWMATIVTRLKPYHPKQQLKGRVADQSSATEQAWSQANSQDTIETYNQFIADYSSDPPAEGLITQARARIQEKARQEAARQEQARSVLAGMQFVQIPAGSFMMGSASGLSRERPVREVTITRPFSLQTTAVTQGQWRAVMGDNPSGFKNGDDYPVKRVSWDDAQKFLKRLNQLDPGKNYRLPTEAEWEYACRAGTTGERYGELDAIAWYRDNSGGQTHPVGRKQPNAWGLYDMLGNVSEWCADWYDENYYANSPATDPHGPAGGEFLVARGGSWWDEDLFTRSASRRSFPPDARFAFNGFRCVQDGDNVQQEQARQEDARQEQARSVLADMQFVQIPAGSFMMGSTNGLRDCDGFMNEKPVCGVILTQSFYLQTTEVTQGQWRAVMGDNPSQFKFGDDYPAENVSWDDVQEFLKKLNALDPGKNYRLPTEAEWEYACRAGTTGERYGELDAIAWYNNNSGNQTHPVGKKQPNAWGLYDMLGNVWEWCADWYGKNYYTKSPTTDPRGPSSGQCRVLRGGSWGDYDLNVHSASRGGNYPAFRYFTLGFRCARD